MSKSRWLGIFPIACALAAGISIIQRGTSQTHVTTMVFQGLQNLPLYAAQQKGFFAKHGLIVDQRIAPGSQELRDGLAQGRYQIVHTAVDNAIAMAEQAKADVVVVLGGDNGWNDLIVQPEIGTYTDLRGKTVAGRCAGYCIRLSPLPDAQAPRRLSKRDYSEAGRSNALSPARR